MDCRLELMKNENVMVLKLKTGIYKIELHDKIMLFPKAKKGSIVQKINITLVF